MKTFERVLFLLAFLCLSVCTARHIYRLWIEPRASVLDEFRGPLVKEIIKAKSLNELVVKYRVVKKQVDEEDKKIEALEKKELETPQAEGQDGEDGSRRKRFVQRNSEREPYKSEDELRDAITEWEEKTHEIFELRIYCLFGFLSVILGVIVHRKRSEWLGLAMLVTGFSELVYWASPSFRGANSVEFDKLLMNKLGFSFASLLLLLAMGCLLGLMKEERE
jgi:hypothetical protein